MLDITWDDPVGQDMLLYDYFLVTSAQLAKDHTWEQGDYPHCTATTLNAEYVRQLAAGDQTVYTRYDASMLVTQAEAEAEFVRMRSGCLRPLPGEAVQPEPETHTSEPTVIPPATMSQQPQPPAPTGTVNPPAPAEENGGWMVAVVIAVLIVAAAAAGVVVFLRMKAQENTGRSNRYRPARSFDDLKSGPISRR
jgi:hypothetical protein